MRESTANLPALTPVVTRPRLSTPVFYGIILAGLLCGIVTAPLAGWYYLEHGNADPVGRRIWSDVAKWLVIPICAMIGTTFGGLTGFITAVFLERLKQRRSGAMANLIAETQ